MQNSICEILKCSYVGTMNWQQLLPLAAVLGVAVFLVWRSSGQKKHDHDCGCGCEHGNESDAGKKAQP